MTLTMRVSPCGRMHACSAALRHVVEEDVHGPRETAQEHDEDVAAEESRMRALLNHRTGASRLCCVLYVISPTVRM